MVCPFGPGCVSAGRPNLASTSCKVDCPGTSAGPLAQPASASRKTKARLLALAGIGTEVFLELVGLILVRVRIRGRRAFAGNVGPLHRELGVHLQPLFRLAVRIRNDRLRRALWLAYAAVDALVRMDHEHVVALVEAIDGADFHAVHVLALDAVFGDDVSHLSFLVGCTFRGWNYRTSIYGDALVPVSSTAISL